MIFGKPIQKEFDFDEKIIVDVDNNGFTQEEMEKLVGSQQVIPAAKGIEDWWSRIWKPNREVPPEIENLNSDFGYQTQPFLTNLVKVANIQNTPLEGQIIALSENYNFFIMLL